MHAIKTLKNKEDQQYVYQYSSKIIDVVKENFQMSKLILEKKNFQEIRCLTSVAKSVSEKYNKKVIVMTLYASSTNLPIYKKKTIELIIQKLINKESDCAVSLKRIKHEHPYEQKKFIKKLLRSLIKI